MNKKICVVGAGRWGKNHIRTLSEMGNLGGIVESNPNRLSGFRSRYSTVKCYQDLEDSLIDNYGGYIVATPAETHFDIGSFLLKEKKNVLIEKPLSLTSSDALKLINLSKECNCKLMVGHLLLFHPAIIKIKELIDNGKVGKLLCLYSTRLNFGTVRTKENVFFSFAPHDISVLNYLIGKSPVSINAVGSCPLKQNVHDVVIANFTYQDDIEAHIFVSWLYPFKEQRLVVIGDKGMLSFDDSTLEKNLYFYNKGIEWKEGCPLKLEKETEIIGYEISAPLKNELENFITSLDSDVKIADGQSGYEVIKILEEVTEKLHSNK